MTDVIHQYFSCGRCGKNSKTKQALEKHLMKKNICHPINLDHDVDRSILLEALKKSGKESINCDICGKEFSSKPSMYRHKKHYCEKQNSSLQDRVLFLEEMVKTLQEKTNLPTTIIQKTNIENQNIQINNFQINNFGNENYSSLTTEFLSDCVLHLNNGMKSLVQKIHFDPNTPENHNLRFVSKKHNLLEKYSDGVWQLCDKNNTLDELIRKGYKILFQHFMKNKSENDDDIETMQRNDHINTYFQKLMNKDNSVYYQLRRDLFIMVMNGTLYVLGKDNIDDCTGNKREHI